MKKILLATTMLVAGAGVAAADVTISGLGRFGVNYAGGAVDPAESTTIGGRLRFNIDASTETDSGVTFGGRIRIQNDIGSSSRGTQSSVNAALLFAEYAGFRMEVGNTNTAIDSAGLWYESEIGYDYSISGNGIGDFFAYNTGSNPGVGYLGLFASYSVGDFTARISHMQLDQYSSVDAVGDADETSISADYVSGPFGVSAAYVTNGAGNDGLDGYFLGASYEVNADAKVALLYYNEDTSLTTDATTVTLTGSYVMGQTTLKGFVSSSDDRGTEDTAYGIGAEYDLGGATLAGAVGNDWAGDTNANVGVRFSF